MRKLDKSMLPGENSIYLDGRFYDLYIKQRELTDLGVTFFLEQAKKFGGPILDLACGTGRITIPLAEAGFSVVGLDLSKPMLEQAKKKAKTKGLEIMWVQGNMTGFELKRKFNLILMAGNAFTHLEMPTNLEGCFSSVRRHLAQNGRFIFDTFNPNLQILTRDSSKRYPVIEFTDPDSGETMTITESNEYDKVTQMNRIRRFHRIGDQETSWELNLRMYFPQELDGLLKYNGFSIEAKYGNYEKQSFESNMDLQILVCQLESPS
jgi:2-polyprenyl-3-methyl-5-hydroxy-6-metoxy-1,4-benzoquinol methylase